MNEAPVITVEPTSISANFPERNTFVYTDGPVSIRHLTDTPDDRAFAARLTVEAFREKAVHATSERSIPKVIDSFTNHMQDQTPQYYERNFIAEHNGEKAGLVTIKCHGDLAERLFCVQCVSLDGKSIPRGKCYVDHICVDENFRGKGIGKALMEFCDIEARRIGCKSIFLDVTTTNRARNLYERQGYEIQDTIYGCCWSYRCIVGVKDRSHDALFTQPAEVSVRLHSDGPVTIRYLTDTQEDCAFAGRLMVEAFRGKFVHASSERSLPKVTECSQKSLRGQDPLYFKRNLIAEYNGQRAGLLMLKIKGDPPERLLLFDFCAGMKAPTGKCYVDHICVDEHFRGKGIGKVLLELGDEEARNNGCREIFLYVATSNRAKNLYERHGYHIENTKYGCCGCGLWCATGEKVGLCLDTTYFTVENCKSKHKSKLKACLRIPHLNRVLPVTIYAHFHNFPTNADEFIIGNLRVDRVDHCMRS
ncbi:hypothetical protein FSP39_018523 [Pinctada imbricata]|uniref:N-acetyltransferase domain-containing protein n=1 Tax=Pinctada imbricata TaxID=66713 RepID=A0AA88Y571_PINIB|nr:hypothetical protein FSP39_018523 [Pinctada imbricata]